MKKLLLVLTALLTLTLIGCKKEIIVDGSCVDGSNLVTIEVVYEDEAINEVYQYCTNEEYLLGVMDANSEDLELEVSSAGFVDGLKGFNFADMDVQIYWAIFINEEYGMLGVSDQPVTDGDIVKFEATSW
jgi:hypothetical protein